MEGRRAAEAVVERRLRPLYDALDGGQNKRALQEADKVLRKHADCVCAKALKALALVRLSRRAEARRLVDELLPAAQTSADTNALLALSHCFKELARPDLLVSLYEGACRHSPKNEELQTQLFLAYARSFRYKCQQQTAMQLFKDFPKNAYYFWAVMSIVMQAIADPALASTMYLPLAEKMVRVIIRDSKIRAEPEVRLFALIFEMQKKYDELLKLLEGPLADEFLLPNMWDMEYEVLKAMQRVGRFDEMLLRCRKSLQARPDDWRLYTSLFDAGFALIDERRDQKTEIIEQLTETVLCAVGGAPAACRGPRLARLRLIAGLLERDFVVRAELGEPLRLLAEYFALVGDLPCCFDDMQPLLCLLGDQQRDEFVAEVTRSAALADDAATPKQVQRHVNALLLLRALNCCGDASFESVLQRVKHLLTRYHKALQLGKSLSESDDFRCADSYMLLAVQLLWQLFESQGDIKLLYQMILLLEFGISNSQNNFHFKWLLCKFYGITGASSCLAASFESLDIKYVQNDSIGYLVFDRYTDFGSYSELMNFAKVLSDLFSSSDRELLESLVAAYRNGSFGRIPEYVDYGERCRSSLHRVAADISRLYLAAVTADGLDDMCRCFVDYDANSDCKDGMPSDKALSDNRDFDVFLEWQNADERAARAEERKRSFQETINVTRLRYLLTCVLQCASQSEKTSDSTPAERSLRSLTSQFKAHYRHCRTVYTQPFLPTLHGPPPSLFYLYLQGGYVEALDCVMDCAYLILEKPQLVDASTDDAAAADADHSPDRIQRLPSVEQLHTIFRRMLEQHQLSTTGGGAWRGVDTPVAADPQFPFLQLCHVSWLLQTLAVCAALAAAVCRSVGAPAARQKGSKKKQHKGAVTENGAPSTDAKTVLVERFRQLCPVISSAIESVEQLLSDLQLLLDTDSLSISISASAKWSPICDAEFSSLLVPIRNRVSCGLRESYRKSMLEMQLLLEGQRKLMSSIKRNAH